MKDNQGDMKKRLVQFATEHLGITIHRFEKSCGLSNSYCSNPNAVGTYAKKKITETYPELNMDWVMTGKGGMLNTQSKDEGHVSRLAGTGKMENTEESRLNDRLTEEAKELKIGVIVVNSTVVACFNFISV
jgi:hypothetical protein